MLGCLLGACFSSQRQEQPPSGWEQGGKHSGLVPPQASQLGEPPSAEQGGGCHPYATAPCHLSGSHVPGRLSSVSHSSNVSVLDASTQVSLYPDEVDANGGKLLGLALVHRPGAVVSHGC